jgi:hypothetical protein
MARFSSVQFSEIGSFHSLSNWVRCCISSDLLWIPASMNLSNIPFHSFNRTGCSRVGLYRFEQSPHLVREFPHTPCGLIKLFGGIKDREIPSLLIGGRVLLELQNGRVLGILNLWAKVDRHRRLNLVGTAISKGNLGFGFPSGSGMSIESCDFEVGRHLLEHDTEVARFKVKNFIPGTQMNVNAQFALEVLVNEIPGMCKIQDATFTMGVSVSAVRESFEKHYGIKR